MRLFAVFLLFFCSCAFGQEVIFYKEDITFRLTSKYFIAEGTYWFSNPSDHDVQSPIYYPFPANGEVDSTDIFDISKGTQPKVSNRTDAGFSWVVAIDDHDTALYHIAYRQKIDCDSAVYILRSTQSWNKPLEYAEYKLIVEDSIMVTGYSFEPNKVYDIDGKKIYLWRYSNFMPGKDFVVHFRPK